jgi:hypothetical protein
MSAPRSISGIWDFGYRAASAGIRKGVFLIIGADNTKAVKATAARQGRWRGVAMDEGALPDGTANYGQDAQHLAEPINAQKAGIATVLCPANQQVNEGDQAVSDANGMVVPRAPFSLSAFIAGQFDETKLIGPQPAYSAVELFPHYVEVVRSVTASGLGGGAIGITAGKFFDPHAAALSATPVPVYRVKYTGEVLRNLGLTLKTAPGGADSVTLTYQKSSDGGTTWTDIAGPSAQATAAAKLADDQTNVSPALTKGDLIALKIASTAVTAADPVATFDAT